MAAQRFKTRSWNSKTRCCRFYELARMRCNHTVTRLFPLSRKINDASHTLVSRRAAHPRSSPLAPWRGLTSPHLCPRASWTTAARNAFRVSRGITYWHTSGKGLIHKLLRRTSLRQAGPGRKE